MLALRSQALSVRFHTLQRQSRQERMVPLELPQAEQEQRTWVQQVQVVQPGTAAEVAAEGQPLTFHRSCEVEMAHRAAVAAAALLPSKSLEQRRLLRPLVVVAQERREVEQEAAAAAALSFMHQQRQLERPHTEIQH